MRNALRVRRGRGRSPLGITLLGLALALGVLAATTGPAAAATLHPAGMWLTRTFAVTARRWDH